MDCIVFTWWTVVISRTALANKVLGFAIESELAISQRASDGAALTVARIARTFGIGNSLAVPVVFAFMFTTYSNQNE